MAAAPPENIITIVIIYESKSYPLQCDPSLTIGWLRDTWYDLLEAYPLVTFFTMANRCVTEGCTISEALVGSATPELLVLRALPTSTIIVQVFGFEHSLAPFEVVDSSTPSAVKREIGKAVGIVTDDYRLLHNNVELDLRKSFNAQGITEGSKLIVDLHVNVNVEIEKAEDVERRRLSCFGSQTVGDLHQELCLEDNIVLVSSWPWRRALRESLHLCHIVNDVIDLHAPINLISEKKVSMTFEPLGLSNCRRQVAVALSACPLDLYQELASCFEMNAEFRLAVGDEPLEEARPLDEQDIDATNVIQLDVLRTCKIEDQWSDLRGSRFNAEVFLYSTESPSGLLLSDFLLDQQTLVFEGIDISIFGSLLDLFGLITGKQKSTILIDRDVERSVSILAFEQVTRKQAWARTMMFDIVPKSRGVFPKEVMCYGDVVPALSSMTQLRLESDAMIMLDPLKIIIKNEKKLQVHRFPHGSTHGDVLAKIRQQKDCEDVGLKIRGSRVVCEQIHSKMDVELYLLESARRFKTKLMVSINSKGYGCWFESDTVRLTDIFIKYGQEANVSPRTLFHRTLFCVGCGRKMTAEEEQFQAVPSNCCRVRSLQLTDRRGKDVGVQSRVPRNKDVETFTLYPRERDAATQTRDKKKRKTVQTTEGNRRDRTCSAMTSQIGAIRMRALVPPPPPRTVEFNICWKDRKGKDFNFDITFIPPLVGERLRAEIAKCHNCDAADLLLFQERSHKKSDGALLLRGGMWLGSNVCIWGWSDENGEDVRHGRWGEVTTHEVIDAEAVPLPGEKMARINIQKIDR